MEKIREAVERARAQQHSLPANVIINNSASRRVSASAAPATPVEPQIAEMELEFKASPVETHHLL